MTRNPEPAKVIGGSMTLRRAIAEELTELGIACDECERWSSPASSPALVICVHEPGVESWPDDVVDSLVVCCELSAAAVRAAIEHGAIGVVDIRWRARQIARRAVEALSGSVCLPYNVLLGLIADDSKRQIVLTPVEQRWLSLLAAGTPAPIIAETTAISERELYRRLRQMYGRLDVTGREGAIAAAARAGWI